MSTESTEALIERVLEAHVDVTDRSAEDGCSCGHPDPRTYAAHVAAAITQALAEREARRNWATAVAASIRAKHDGGSERTDNRSDR